MKLDKSNSVLDPDRVRDLSVEVYKRRLEDSSGGGSGAVERMLENDADGGKKLRLRAASYDSLSRAYVEALDVDFPRVQRKESK